MARTPDPTRLVADADVLSADLFLDGPARAAVEVVWRHSWLELLASEELLADARHVIAELGDDTLASGWVDCIADQCVLVDHPSQDHPALASAYAGQAAHVLTYDPALTSPDTGIAMRKAMPISARTPEAFLSSVDVASLFQATFDEAYPGPDAPARV